MGSGTARLLHAGAFLAALLVAAVQLAPVTHACAGANLSSDAPGRESGQAVASAEASPTLPVLTTLTISAPATCDYGASVAVTAVLMGEGGAPLEAQSVTIERIGADGTVLTTALTDASGRIVVDVAPTRRLTLRARFDGTAEYAAAASDQVVVRPKVKLTAPWTHGAFAYPGQRLPARGRIWPKHSEANTSTILYCERYENGGWVVRAKYRAKIINKDGKSSYSGVVKFPSSGTWRVRAKHNDGNHSRTLGPTTKVKVSNWRKKYVGKKMGGFKTSKKMVAITIDDGPNRRTLKFCDVLERYGGRGTFFFTNRLLSHGYGSQAKKVYDRGHEVANHTANHKMLTGSYATSYREAIIPKRSIKRYTGFEPIWIRAMGGGINSTGMRAVKATDQLYINWSIDSYDSHRQYTPPGTLYRNVMRSVKPGAVILIHQTHPETLEALPRICRELRRRGYKMVTVSELAAQSEPR